MPSTSSSDLILDVQNLHMVMRADVHRSNTWRELFIRSLRDPIGTILNEQKSLYVLRDISFSLRQGDRVALIGVNGTGKTTLCRCVAGFYIPSLGSITMNGEVRSIFDTSVGIHPELTGRENAELLAQFMYPQRQHDLKQLVNEALEFTELGQFLDVPYKLYSNGMQARLCLSIISAAPSDLLILDEVFDGADRFFREKISKRILSMIELSGAVIFVSHSPEQVRQVCNRLILLNRGSIAFDGPVEEGLKLYDQLDHETFDSRTSK